MSVWAAFDLVVIGVLLGMALVMVLQEGNASPLVLVVIVFAVTALCMSLSSLGLLVLP